MTIAGAVYVISLFFVIAWIAGANVKDLGIFESQVEHYKTYVGLAAVALSYIFGFVAHRCIQIASRPCRLLAKHKPCKQIEGALDWIAGAKELTDRMRGEMAIWEISPQRIHQEIDFQFAQVALFRSLAVSVPCLVLSIRAWRLSIGLLPWPAVYWKWIWLFYVLLILAFWRQSFQYDRIRDEALAVSSRHGGCLVPNLSQTSGPFRTEVTIRGINFGKSQGESTITFNGAPVHVSPLCWNPTWILVSVPAGTGVGAGKFVIQLAGASDTGVKFTMTFACPFWVTK